MISKELSAALGFAVKEAKKRRHEYVCLEHVLFAITHDDGGVEIIESCGGNVINLKEKLTRFLDKRIESIPDEGEAGHHLVLKSDRVKIAPIPIRGIFSLTLLKFLYRSL